MTRSRPSSSRAAAAVLALASLSLSVNACGGDLHMHRKRVDRSNEAAEATILNPQEECSYYNFQPVSDLMAANALPPIWEKANVSFTGAPEEAKALFRAINASIPNIPQKGDQAMTGNFQGVSYNGATDPDCWWTYSQCTSPKLKGLRPDVTRCAEPNTWGFTLDDGPNCSHNAYYDYLETINQKATLFYIGSNVVDWPLEAQRGLDNGHEICAHTWSHKYMTALSNEEAFAELYFSRKAIKEVLGISVQCWRPPFGDVDDRIRYIAQALGMATVVWADNTFDYLIEQTNATYIQDNYNKIFDKQTAGDYNTIGTIVLSHELTNGTMEMSKKNLPQIQKQFAHAAPVAVCNNNTQPYIEPGYTYPNFAQWAAGTRTISLASATAVSSGVGLTLPFSAGQTGSVFPVLNYYSGATAGATSAGTVAAPTGTGVNPAAGAASQVKASGSTSGASATSSSHHSSGSRLSITSGAFAGVLCAVGGVLMGSLLV